jgi:cobalt-zinc-cadmium efflux system protein
MRVTDRLDVASSAHDHADCAHHAALDAVRAGRPDITRRLAWALALTAGFMLAEVAGGLVANSLALLADAGHMLTDAGALALALAVAWWNARRAEDGAARHHRREAWAAGVNAVVLLLVCVGIAVEAVPRLQMPEPVATGVMLAVAVVGLAVNVAAAAILRPVVRDNLNARGAYLHVLGDLLGSVGTITAALIIRQTGWLVADAIASLAVCLLVLRAAIGLLREATGVLREAPAAETHTAP